MLKKIISLTLIILMVLSLNAFAVDTYNGYNIPIDIDINGSFIKCVQKPIIINGTTYIPLRAFSDAIGGALYWNDVEKGATMIKDNHSFSFYPEKGISVIDGVTSSYPSVIYNNLTFIPVRAISETLNYSVTWDEFYLTVKITAPGVIVADAFKDYSYTYDDMMYLGKITQMEGGYQAFDAKIGIASTILNRVKSPKFPSTIKDVIYDTKYGVQFPPVHTERMASITPTKDTILAIKCALRGANPVGNSLYFTDVKSAPSSWVHKNRPYHSTINDMNFYE